MKSSISIRQKITEKNKNDEKINIIKSFDLLQNLTSTNHITLTKSPIETIVINNAINTEKYNLLDDECIKLKDVILLDKRLLSPIILHSNSLCKVNINDINDSSLYMSPLWKIFLEYHNSNTFIDQISNLFNISSPLIINDFNIEYRMPIFSDYIPEPVITLDKKVICYGIYLMKKKEDKSNGGNLEIYFQDKRVLNIVYQSNCLVLIKNIQSRNDIKIQFSKRNQTLHSHRVLTFSLFTRNF
jgi:hypothetical protein